MFFFFGVIRVLCFSFFVFVDSESARKVCTANRTAQTQTKGRKQNTHTHTHKASKRSKTKQNTLSGKCSLAAAYSRTTRQRARTRLFEGEQEPVFDGGAGRGARDVFNQECHLAKEVARFQDWTQDDVAVFQVGDLDRARGNDVEVVGLILVRHAFFDNHIALFHGAVAEKVAQKLELPALDALEKLDLVEHINHLRRQQLFPDVLRRGRARFHVFQVLFARQNEQLRAVPVAVVAHRRSRRVLEALLWWFLRVLRDRIHG